MKHLLSMKSIFFGLGGLLLIVSTAAAYTYVVQPGDTLSEIAARELGGPIYGNGGSLRALLEANSHIHNPDLIRSGAVIEIPKSSLVFNQDEEAIEEESPEEAFYNDEAPQNTAFDSASEEAIPEALYSDEHVDAIDDDAEFIRSQALEGALPDEVSDEEDFEAYDEDMREPASAEINEVEVRSKFEEIKDEIKQEPDNIESSITQIRQQLESGKRQAALLSAQRFIKRYPHMAALPLIQKALSEEPR